MSRLRALYVYAFGPTLDDLHEAVIEAVKAEAEAASDVVFNEQMGVYFTERVNSIDPWKDHHGFATARDEQLHYQAAAARHILSRDAKARVVSAAKARYVSMRDGLDRAVESESES